MWRVPSEQGSFKAICFDSLQSHTLPAMRCLTSLEHDDGMPGITGEMYVVVAGCLL